MKPTATINTGTLTFLIYVLGMDRLFQKCHPLSGWSLRANDTNPGDTWLSKGAFGYACMRARSIHNHRRGEASLAGNENGIGKLLKHRGWIVRLLWGTVAVCT